MSNEAEQARPQNDELDQFQRRNVLVHPHLIEDHWQDGKKPMHYFKHWQHLTLEFKDYQFVRSYEYYTTWDDDLSFIDEMEEEAHFVRLGDKPENAEQSQYTDDISDSTPEETKPYSELSSAERRKFFRKHLDRIKPVKDGQGIMLAGWADIEWRRSIDVFSCDTPEKNDELNYKRTFRKMKVTIKEGSDRTGGVIMHWTEELGRGEDDPDEDFLVAELYVPVGSLSQLESDLEHYDTGAPLIAHLEAYLFQHEMEASLAEPDTSQSYVMAYNTTATAIVNTIGIRPKGQQAETDEEEDWDYEEEQEKVDPEAAFRVQLLRAVSGLNNSLAGMKLAVWLLALLLLISLFV